MKPRQYLEHKLTQLRERGDDRVSADELAVYVVRKLLSKKFRKYSVDLAFRNHVENVVKNAIKENKPIGLVWVFGGYKLWRLPTAPEPDWAELFSMLYFAQWLKPVADVYAPGVVFDFYSDDVIVARMNGLDQKDIDSYVSGFKELLTWFTAYLPENMRFVFNRVADQYTPEEFSLHLKENMEKLNAELNGGLPVLSAAQRDMVELNVKSTELQLSDPKWRERVLLVHDAYAKSSRRRPYYRNENKIMVINTPIPGALAIGTTKKSVVKFWVGMGVLEIREESYIENILSPSQLENVRLTYEACVLDGLGGKNFKQIPICRK